MNLISTADFDTLEEEILYWLNNTPNGKMYHDCKGIAKSAIMEFLANKDNITIFKHLAENENTV